MPSTSLVLIITAYNTVFGNNGTPDGFSFILAIDWFMDRCRTVTNVTGDAVVAGIVAYRVSLENEEEEDTHGDADITNGDVDSLKKKNEVRS